MREPPRSVQAAGGVTNHGGLIPAMIVTGLFLAEKATVIDGKLHVWGGVLDYWTVGADRIAEFGLVILVQAEPGDTAWTIGLELRSPNGAAVDLPSASCPDAEAGENRFACPTFTAQFPDDGRHVFIATTSSRSGESTAAVGVEIRSAPQ